MKKPIIGRRAALIGLVALAAIGLGALSAAVVGALGQHTSAATEASKPTAAATSATTTIAGNGPATGPGSRPAPVVYRPANLSRAAPVALVVALHGSGGTPPTFETATGLDAVANRHGFVVAYLGSPRPTAPAWRGVELSRNLAYISSEVRSVTASENIDPRRVYVTGFSAGATMAFFVGCRLSSLVDGIAPVSGAMRFADRCHPSHPVSELEIIGTSDAIPVSGSALLLSTAQVAARWRKLDGCSSQLGRAVIGSAQVHSWSRCNRRSGVGLYVIKGGTHQWPGPSAEGPDSRLPAAEAVWAFFAAHPGGS
jgi:polyhydroxybutyrate depolymerase